METEIESNRVCEDAIKKFQEEVAQLINSDNNNEGGVRVRVPVKTQCLVDVLEQCHKAIQILKSQSQSQSDADDDFDDHFETDDVNSRDCDSFNASNSESESESEQFCHRLKSQVDSPAFLEKLGSIHASISQAITERPDEGSSWDIITESDFQDCAISDVNGVDQEFVLVSEEDIVDGIACFMATYLTTLKETKDLTPKQLQKALSKTFSKKRKGKFRQAWDRSKIIYNVVSWGATAVGMYQNPALTKAASVAFWSCCRVFSKLI